MILATQLLQPPCTPLEQMLVDADLDALRRTDFLARNRDLRTELASCGVLFSDVPFATPPNDMLCLQCRGCLYASLSKQA